MKLSSFIAAVLAATWFASGPVAIAQEDQGDPGAGARSDLYSQLWTGYFPTYYGGVLDHFKTLRGGDALKGFYEKLDKINKLAGAAATFATVGQQLGAGSAGEAGVTFMLALASEVSGWEAAGPFLAKVGLTPNIFQTAIVAGQIWYESHRALQAARAETRIESLYGSIESDKALFKGRGSGRTLGTGNPIPVTREAVDHVFQRILNETGFRNGFKDYYEQVLGRTFPEPSTFEIFRSGSARAQDQLTRERLQGSRAEINEGIQAVLAQLNAEAKKREAERVLRAAVQDALKAFHNAPEMLSGVEKLTKIVNAQLPEVEAFARQLPGWIDAAEKDKNFDALSSLRRGIRSAIGDTLRYLPSEGDLGAKRRSLSEVFRTAWSRLDALDKQRSSVQEAQRAEAEKSAQAIPAAAVTLSVPEVPFELTFEDLQPQLDRAANMVELQTALKTVNSRVETALGEHGEQMDKARKAAEASNQSVIDGVRKQLWAQLEAKRISRRQFDEGDQALNNAGRKYFIQTRAREQVATDRKKELTQKLEDYVALKVAAFSNMEKEVESGLRDMELKLDKSLESFPPSPKGVSGQVADAEAWLDGLKDVGYVGLPQVQFPKWDAARPTKLLEYLAKLRANVEREKRSLEDAIPKLHHAEAIANAMEKLKPTLSDFRRDLERIKQHVNSRRLKDLAPRVGRLELALAALDRLAGRASKLDFDRIHSQLEAPQVEQSYIIGLIGQVQRAAELLSQYHLYTVSHQGAPAQVVIVSKMFTNDPQWRPGALTQLGGILTTQDLQALPGRLHETIEEIGLYAIDRKSNFGLRSFVDAQLGAYGRAFSAAHYAVFWRTGDTRAQLVTDQDLGSAAKEIDVLQVKSDFASTLEKKFRTQPLASLDLTVGSSGGLLQIGMARLKQLSSGAYDAAVQNAARSLISAIDGKLRKYGKIAKDIETQELAARRRDADSLERSAARRDTGSPAPAAAAGAQGPDIAKIREMYQRFVEAYQSKNLSTVVRIMSPDWEASDGTTITELEGTLRNSFRMFDSIRFSIDGLQIQSIGGNKYEVSYSANIVGQINRLNVKHQEKSAVKDVVAITAGGPRIEKTTGGQVWMK